MHACISLPAKQLITDDWLTCTAACGSGATARMTAPARPHTNHGGWRAACCPGEWGPGNWWPLHTRIQMHACTTHVLSLGPLNWLAGWLTCTLTRARLVRAHVLAAPPWRRRQPVLQPTSSHSSSTTSNSSNTSSHSSSSRRHSSRHSRLPCPRPTRASHLHVGRGRGCTQPQSSSHSSRGHCLTTTGQSSRLLTPPWLCSRRRCVSPRCSRCRTA